MANLTITIEDTVLKRARLRAMEQGTSINAVIRDYLEAYTGGRNEQQAAIADLIALSKKSRSRKGGKTWTRDDLYRRR